MLRHGRRHLEPRCSRVRSIAAMVLLWWSTSRVLFHIVNQSITTESITSQPLVMVSSDISTSFRSSTASEVTTEGGIEMRLLLLLLLLSSLCITHHAVRSIRNTHGKRGHHSPLTVVTLLMLCGDIEYNPGPNTSQVYPCGICDRKVKWEDEGVACDNCNIWFHCS